MGYREIYLIKETRFASADGGDEGVAEAGIIEEERLATARVELSPLTRRSRIHQIVSVQNVLPGVGQRLTDAGVQRVHVAADVHYSIRRRRHQLTQLLQLRHHLVRTQLRRRRYILMEFLQPD